MPKVKKLISFDAHIATELEAVAEALNISQKELVERALDFYFDHTDSIIAQKISEDVEKGSVAVYDANEVFAQLGLNDV